MARRKQSLVKESIFVRFSEKKFRAKQREEKAAKRAAAKSAISPIDTFKNKIKKNIEMLKTWNGEERLSGAVFSKAPDGFRVRFGFSYKGDDKLITEKQEDIHEVLTDLLDEVETDDELRQIIVETHLSKRKKKAKS